jgi:hypothetical protein
MNTEIPSAEQVRQALEPLTMAQLDRLAELSGVPAPTLTKIKYGQTEKPGLDTVRAFLGHIEAALQPAAA